LADEKTPQVIFQAVNNHGSASGTPPYTNTSASGRYFGYYENEHKEQFIFIYDRERKQGTLLMGDYGWDKPIAIVDPQKPDVVLSKNEWLWLQACWMAATAFERM
jgi:hypothetical protein